MIETDKKITEAMQAGSKKVGRSWSVCRLTEKGTAAGPATDFYVEADAKLFAKSLTAEGIKFSAWCNYTLILEW